MDLAWISLLALVIVIVVSCTSRVNPGVVAVVLAWVIGIYLAPLFGTPIGVSQLMAGFPSDLFLTLTRVTPLGGGGATIATGGYLAGPLGLTIAPNGDILTANANDGNIVETTPAGAEFQPFDTGAGGGGLFGLVVAPNQKGVLFVDDAANTLALAH